MRAPSSLGGTDSGRQDGVVRTVSRIRPAGYSFPDIMGSSISCYCMIQSNFMRLVYFHKHEIPDLNGISRVCWRVFSFRNAANEMICRVIEIVL